MSAYLYDRQVSDARTVQTGTDVWIVSNPTGSPISDSQLPALGSAHPIDTRMRVDRIEGRPKDGQVGLTWAVSVYYSSDARYSGPPQNNSSDLLFKTIQDTFARVEIELPMLAKIYVDKPVASGAQGPAEPIVDWIQTTIRRDSYVENVQIKLNRATYSYDDRQAIQKQQNKYHYLQRSDDTNIAARLYRFNGCEVVQLSNNPTSPLWQYTYSWVGDGDFSAMGLSADIKVADGGPVGSEKFLVPPKRFAFGHYVVSPSSGTVRPTISVIYPYVDASPSQNGDITGYTFGASILPGNPV